MISPHSLQDLNRELRDRMQADRAVLDQLRAEIRPLRQNTRRIQPRSTTAISLVATDGGNNRIEFDPYSVQVVRVVDSSANEYCLEVVTPTTDVNALSQRQFARDGTPLTALAKMMACLGIRHLWELSPMIQRPPEAGRFLEPPKPSWVQVYRELVEWAILLELIRA